MIDDEIIDFAASAGGRITSIVPLLDHLARAHPELAPDELVADVDAAIDRLYRDRRATFAGHRWLSERPAKVAGFLIARRAELRWEPGARTWSWTGTQWTENLYVLRNWVAPIIDR